MDAPAQTPPVCAIIVAAGSSRRMGFDKLWAELAGEPVFVHSLRACARCPEVEDLVLVVASGSEARFQSAASSAALGKPIRIVTGGAERQHSVWNGLQTCALPLVAVLDAARPLTLPEDICSCVRVAAKEGAACLASPVADTLKRVDAQGKIAGSVERTSLWAMETPQIFYTTLLRAAYQALRQTDEVVTDEASAVERNGGHVFLVPSQEANFKITYPRDLRLAEHVLAARSKGAAQ